MPIDHCEESRETRTDSDVANVSSVSVQTLDLPSSRQPQGLATVDAVEPPDAVFFAAAIEALDDQHGLGHVLEPRRRHAETDGVSELHAEALVRREPREPSFDWLGLQQMCRRKLRPVDEVPLACIFEDRELVLKTRDREPHSTVPHGE